MERRINVTPEQKAAFINAQTAIFDAKSRRLSGLILLRMTRKEDPTYEMHEYDKLVTEMEAVIGWNATITFFQD
jgi:hypothetical protein